MDEFAPPRDAAVSLPHPQHCPPWCTECQHDDLDPPYTALHRSPPAIVTLYDERCDVTHAQVRAAYWDKAPVAAFASWGSGALSGRDHYDQAVRVGSWAVK